MKKLSGEPWISWWGTFDALMGSNWPRLAIRKGDWKLVMNYDGSRKELYHVPQDRTEQNNLSAAHPERVAQLSRELGAWKKTLPEEPASHCISKFRK